MTENDGMKDVIHTMNQLQEGVCMICIEEMVGGDRLEEIL